MTDTAGRKGTCISIVVTIISHINIKIKNNNIKCDEEETVIMLCAIIILLSIITYMR